jgi:hypothetical protein
MSGMIAPLALLAVGLAVGFAWGAIFAIAIGAARPQPTGQNRNTPHARRRLRSRTQAAMRNQRRNSTRRAQP